MYVQRDIFHKRDWCSQLGLGSLARTRLSRVFERPHTLWHLCYCPVPCSAFGKRSKVEEKPGCAQQHRSWHSLKIVFSSDTSVWQRWKHIRILRIFVMTRKFSHRYLFVFLYISRKPLRKEFFFFFFEALLLWVSPASFSSSLQGQPYSMWHFDQAAQTPYIHIWCCLLHCVCSISRALPSVEVWVLEPSLLWPSHIYVYCTFSNCPSFEKITSGFRCWEWPTFFSGCPSHIW